MRSRILLFLATLILVPLLTYFVILFARGYRPSSIGGGSLQATGILAANSLPEGAQLYINSQFKSATDTNLNLPPGSYEIEIKKDTYHSWKKTLEIRPEEVTRAAAVLFPTVPALKAITSAGAAGPALSPDGTKVAFMQTVGKQSDIFILDLNDSPLGILNRDPKQIASLPSVATITWSPDSKQLVLTASPAAYLVDVNNPSQQTTNITARLAALLQDWNLTRTTREAQKFSILPQLMQNTLATAAANLVWSPKENKVLYTATASAVITADLIRQLPGSSTQPQARGLQAGKVYVYDTEEDRNFAVGTAKDKLSWFPTSNHLVKLEPGQVTILEYDGGNPTVVYAGPIENGYAFPYPSSRQLLILANLNPTLSKIANLYAVSLR